MFHRWGASLAIATAAAAYLAVGIETTGCRSGPASADAKTTLPPQPMQPPGTSALVGTVHPTPTSVPTPVPAPTPAPDPASPASRFAKIDVHTHIGPDGIDRAIALMDKWGITGVVNLSGMYPGPPRAMLETQLEAAASAHGRIAVFANANFRRVQHDKNYGKAMAGDLVESKRLGAIGLKIPKGLGLGYPAADGKHLLTVDDRGLDPLFEKAGELAMPVAIHIGDPKAFWKPATPDNERIDELGAHPEWSFYGQPVPSWAELYAAFERRVARHPRTNFIAVHFGNDPEDPNRVAQMLDKYPNFFIDTAARVPEIGRQDAVRMRRFYEKYQDRVLFGTDTGVGPTQDDMMYGSNGPNPPTLEDEARFFRSTWRYFETNDKQFESPTQIQGRWKIDGVGLPDGILRKIYFENAARLLHWKPAAAATPVKTGWRSGDGASATDTHLPSSSIAWSPMAPGAARATVTSGDSAITVQLFRFDLKHFSAEVVVGDGSPPRRQTASDLVHQRRAIAAVNGGFFDEHLAPLGLRIAAMKTRVPLRPKADWGVLVLSPSQARIVHTREFQPRPDITGAIQVGPRIVADGAPLKLRQQSARRTVVALDRDGGMLTLVVVAEAIEANELGALLASLGFDAAMMLDGGPSTQLAVDLDTTRVDIPGGYPVPDLLAIVPAPPPPHPRSPFRSDGQAKSAPTH